MREEATFRRKFGRALKAAREAAGLSQVTVADRAGVTDKYLSRVELGLSTPSVHVAAKLARSLGVTVDALASTVPRTSGVAAAAELFREMTDDEVDQAIRVLRALRPPASVT